MTPLVSRILALGLLFGLIFAVTFGVVLPIGQRFHASAEQRAELEAQLIRFQAAAAGPSLRREVVIADAGLIEAPSDALAAAALQERLEAAAARAAIEIASVRVERPTPLEQARKVTLTAELEGDMAALGALLHGLESGAPYVIVEQLSLRGAGRRTGATADSAEKARIVAIRLRLSSLTAATGLR